MRRIRFFGRERAATPECRLNFLKVRDVLRLLWKAVIVSSFTRSKAGKVTIAGHESDEMPPKTLKSIMKQADIS